MVEQSFNCYQLFFLTECVNFIVNNKNTLTFVSFVDDICID